MMQFAQQRAEVEAELKHEVPDSIWENMVDYGDVQRVVEGESTIIQLAERIQALLEAMISPSRGKPPMRDPHSASMLSTNEPETSDNARIGAYRKALSILIAKEAEEDPLVRAFRSRALHERLLSVDALPSWITRQSEADGEPTLWLTGIPIPPGHEIEIAGGEVTTRPPLTVSKLHPARGTQRRFLRYRAPGEQRAWAIPTAAEGVLEWLRVLVLFTLTGGVPLVELAQVSVHLSLSTKALTRINLTIDPALSPREVAGVYGRVRQRVVGQRHRNLSEKHCALASFVAVRPKEERWSDRLRAWNRQYPNWAYKQESNFRRDSVNSRNRLLQPKYAGSMLMKEA
jgi:hypothetical protein